MRGSSDQCGRKRLHPLYGCPVMSPSCKPLPSMPGSPGWPRGVGHGLFNPFPGWTDRQTDGCSAGLANRTARKVPESWWHRGGWLCAPGEMEMVLLAPHSKAPRGAVPIPGLSPTPPPRGCSWWLLPASSCCGCPPCGHARVAAGCPRLPGPSIPAAPGTLAPSFRQLLSTGENPRRGTIHPRLALAPRRRRVARQPLV